MKAFVHCGICAEYLAVYVNPSPTWLKAVIAHYVASHPGVDWKAPASHPAVTVVTE